MSESCGKKVVSQPCQLAKGHSGACMWTTAAPAPTPQPCRPKQESGAHRADSNKTSALDIQKFRDDLVDGLIIKESDGEPWPLTKSEADQIADELRKRLVTAPRAAGWQREPIKITTDELERIYSASKTCFDPGHNIFWQNFTKAINDYFALAAAEP